MDRTRYRLLLAVLGATLVGLLFVVVAINPEGDLAELPPPLRSVFPRPGDVVVRQTVVEVDLPQAPDRDDPYEHAAETLEEWTLQGILASDRDPALWALTQEYTGPDGNRYNRRGLLCRQQLRDLRAFFRDVGVVDQPSLKAWAEASTFKDDFQGKVRGLGIAVYHWLVMRQGVDTVKPDVHVRRFAEAAVGRPLKDEDVVEVVPARAGQLREAGVRLELHDPVRISTSRDQRIPIYVPHLRRIREGVPRRGAWKRGSSRRAAHRTVPATAGGSRERTPPGSRPVHRRGFR